VGFTVSAAIENIICNLSPLLAGSEAPVREDVHVQQDASWLPSPLSPCAPSSLDEGYSSLASGRSSPKPLTQLKPAQPQTQVLVHVAETEIGRSEGALAVARETARKANNAASARAAHRKRKREQLREEDELTSAEERHDRLLTKAKCLEERVNKLRALYLSAIKADRWRCNRQAKESFTPR